MKIGVPLVAGTMINLGWISVLDWANGTPMPPLADTRAFLSYPTGSWVTLYLGCWAVYGLCLAAFNFSSLRKRSISPRRTRSGK